MSEYNSPAQSVRLAGPYLTKDCQILDLACGTGLGGQLVSISMHLKYIKYIYVRVCGVCSYMR